MWFEALTGFREDRCDDVAARFSLDGEHLTSLANGRRWRHGRFETPSLADLRSRVAALDRSTGEGLRFAEIVASVTDLHLDPANAGAIFQVASQFNTLEMIGPGVTPEEGIDGYEHDHTQGPACAISCGAGTIFRNYFVPVGGGAGQTADRQVECLADLLEELGEDVAVRNGYALADAGQLDRISAHLGGLTETERDALMGKLRIGVHWDTEVTRHDAGHCVTQVFSSAMPVAYSNHSAGRWEPFARLVLDATYEACLAVAAVGAASRRWKALLTLVGGGAFGNDEAWIVAAIDRALTLFGSQELDVAVVSYGHSNPGLRLLTERHRNR